MEPLVVARMFALLEHDLVQRLERCYLEGLAVYLRDLGASLRCP